MGAVRMRVQTADKNTTIIHQMMFCIAKFLQICSDEEINMFYLLDDLRVSMFSGKVYFWMNWLTAPTHTVCVKSFGHTFSLFIIDIFHIVEL